MAIFPKKYKDMAVGTYCYINENITDWVNDYLKCLGYFVMESKPYGKSKLLISLVRMDPFPLVKDPKYPHSSNCGCSECTFGTKDPKQEHPPRNQAGYSKGCDCAECVEYRYLDRRR
jgi:hypothetical protein